MLTIDILNALDVYANYVALNILYAYVYKGHI